MVYGWGHSWISHFLTQQCFTYLWIIKKQQVDLFQSSHHHVLTLFVRYYLVPWLIVYMITIIGLAILAIYLVIIWSAILFIIPSLIFVVLLPIISDIFLIYW